MEFEKEQDLRKLSESGNCITYYSQSTEAEQEIFRTWVKYLLHSQSLSIEFVKANGEIRSMECTLSADLGAKYQEATSTDALDIKETKQKKISNEVCPVWDIKQNAWKSFRWDKLQKIDFKLSDK